MRRNRFSIFISPGKLQFRWLTFPPSEEQKNMYLTPITDHATTKQPKERPKPNRTTKLEGIEPRANQVMAHFTDYLALTCLINLPPRFLISARPASFCFRVKTYFESDLLCLGGLAVFIWTWLVTQTRSAVNFIPSFTKQHRYLYLTGRRTILKNNSGYLDCFNFG